MDNSKILDGKIVAEAVNHKTQKAVEKLKNNNINPGLVVVLVGDDPASAIYVRSKGKACEKLGIFSETIKLDKNTSQDELLNLVKELIADERFHGILVQMPLPEQIDSSIIIENIKPEKDVDCFHPYNVGLISIGMPYLLPCTPAGIIEILNYYKIDPSGKHVVIMGRSNIVGKPMANILIQKAKSANATVTMVHSRTQNIEKYTREADILIAAMGQAEFVTADMIKQGSIIIDVGINRIPEPDSEKGYRLAGDVNFNDVVDKASFITPVPGGVGRMTIAMLMHNTVVACAKQHNFSLKNG